MVDVLVLKTGYPGPRSVYCIRDVFVFVFALLGIFTERSSPERTEHGIADVPQWHEGR